MDYWNAQETSEVCERYKNNMRFGYLPTRNIFDTYTNEPRCLWLQREADSEEEMYFQRLRIKQWGTSEMRSYAWLLFAEDFEVFKDIVIRKVTWHRPEESIYLKNKPIRRKEIIEGERERELRRFPICDSETYFFSEEDTSKLRDLVSILDCEIRGGITLEDKLDDVAEWYELELMRQYKGTHMCSKWDLQKTNLLVESIMADM